MKKIVSIILSLLTIFNFGCRRGFQLDLTLSLDNEYGYLTAYFLSVGEGDATLIRFNSGKIMLIDTGVNSKTVTDYLSHALSIAGGNTIDYLVLSHPDWQHVGNVKYLLENFHVRKIITPKIYSLTKYTAFQSFYAEILSSGVEIDFVDGKSYEEDETYFAFITPFGNDYINAKVPIEDSPYTEEDFDDFAVATYLECKGKRFLLSSDCSKLAEENISNNFETGFFDLLYGKDKINLRDIDFYKASGHGSAKSNCAKLLNILSPKNALISVGANNPNWLPATAMLERLVISNENVRIFRTDVDGTITVRLNESGQAKIETSVF